MAKSKNKRKKAAELGISPKSGAPVATPPPWRSEWFWAALLFAAVITTFSPVWLAGYLWDDSMFVTENLIMIRPTGLVDIWTTRAADVCPLTLTFFWFLHPLFGREPLPYHLITVLLHGASAIVLWQLLKSLRMPGAWLGAALWALYPVNVESVAWIAETKNTFSGLFYFLSALFFVKMARAEGSQPRRFDLNYACALLFAAAAMAAKSSTVVLPVALGLVAWWIDGRWQWRRCVQLAPMVVFAVLAGLASMWTQHLQLLDAPMVQWHRSWPERLVTAGDAIWFYLGKLAWPYPLMMIYPHWQIDTASIVAWLPSLAAAALLVVLWLKRDSWARPWFFAYAYFLFALFPVAGLFDNFFSQYSFVADHFQYLASAGPLALAAAGIARCFELARGKPWLHATVTAAVVTIVGVASWNRAWAFQSQETIWSDTVAKNPACWVGDNCLGDVHFKNGDEAGAIAFYHKGLELNPRDSDAENNLGDVANRDGRYDEAMTHFRKALEVDPRSSQATYNIAWIEMQRHQNDEAMAQMKATLALAPDFFLAHYNIANILLDRNQTDAAIAEFKRPSRSILTTPRPTTTSPSRWWIWAGAMRPWRN